MYIYVTEEDTLPCFFKNNKETEKKENERRTHLKQGREEGRKIQTLLY